MTIAFPKEETRATTPSKLSIESDRLTTDHQPLTTDIPRPISQKRLLANRANAKKSTGPRTPEGKQTVSKNATTHGLTSTTPPELDPAYSSRLYELKKEHNPTTPSQHYLVDQLALIAWKLEQIPQIEAHLVAAHRAEQTQTADPNSSFILPPSSLNLPPSSFAFLFASHLAQNKATPLTRLWDYQRRLLSQFQSVLRQLPQLRKEHQYHRQQQLAEAKFEEDLARGERIDRLCADLPAHNARSEALHAKKYNLPPDHPAVRPMQYGPATPPAQIKPKDPAPSSILNPPSSPPPPPAQMKPTATQTPRDKTPGSVYHAPPMLKTLPFIALFTLFSLANPARAADSPVDQLTQYLQTAPDKRPPLDKQPFATVSLKHEDADAAQKLLWEDHVKQIRESRAQEMKDKKIVEGKLEMPFFYTLFGDKPKNGRSLFISMHGGGGAPKALNDSQWENQKHLYKPAEGVYLAPRAPTNNWNLWHESHIDRMFDRLIEDLIVFEGVDPNRVYIMGYSAGGDGVYQLAPRMADRFAAASMMAGHPNDAQPLGLRNLPFAIHVGALDGAYNRNKIAAEWGKKLDDLQKADPDGYIHVCELHQGRAHWMNFEDAKAVPWMAQYTRNLFPKKIAWKQSTTTHTRFYWLAIPADLQKPGAEIIATLKDQQITIETKDVDRVIVRLNDHMLDLDKPVTILLGDRQLSQALAPRTIATISKTLAERGDPASVFDAEVELKLPVILKKEEKKAGADAPAHSNPVKPAAKPN